jgi:hypothetical protein
MRVVSIRTAGRAGALMARGYWPTVPPATFVVLAAARQRIELTTFIS